MQSRINPLPPEPLEVRGTGRTTRAMQAAPPDAVYVLPTMHMEHYARALAAHLDRKDIKFRSIDWLLEGCYRGLKRDSVVVDHACVDRLTSNMRWREYNDFSDWRRSGAQHP